MPADAHSYFEVPFAALAHRGGFSPGVPPELENTLRAFTAARALGFHYLETDVHATRDGHLIAFHDDRLDRVTDATGLIAELPYAEVSRARIAGSEPIPILSDLLDALPDARFNIDIKHPGAITPLVETLRSHGAFDRVCVGSFTTSSIRAFRQATAGRVATAASPSEVAGFALPGVRRWWPLAADAFQMPMLVPGSRNRLLTPGLIAAAHARGARVHVWTINDRATMERLLDLGVDGIVSDDLVMLKDAVTRRGLWEDES